MFSANTYNELIRKLSLCQDLVHVVLVRLSTKCVFVLFRLKMSATVYYKSYDLNELTPDIGAITISMSYTKN